VIGGKQMSVLSSKRAGRRTPQNYRPVSFVSIPGRVMEQVILETISKQMKDKKIIRSS